MAAVEHCGSAGGAHACEFGMLARVLLNGEMRRLVRGLERGGWIAGRSVQKNFAHRIDGDAAGDLAAFLAAHAVGDYDQTAADEEILIAFGFCIAEAVFVLGPFAAD